MTARDKRRDIALDFTSLLDVTLIILFFFIMFGSLSSEKTSREALDSAAEIKAEAEAKMAQAEQLEQAAESRTEAMQAELDELKRTAADNEQYHEGIEEFAAGSNYKVIYSAENGAWRMEIRRGDKTVTTIDRVNRTPESLMRALEGTPRESYIFCECILTAPEYIESRNALDEMIKKAQESYPHLLVSKTYI